MPVCHLPASRGGVSRAAPRFIVGLAALAGLAAAAARADEVWVAPTYQEDFGGLGTDSNVVWPVTAVGAVRFAWAIPDNLQGFQSAKVVLIPAVGSEGTLNVIICGAENGEAVAARCAGPVAEPFTGVANELLELDVSALVGPGVGAPGLRYLAVFVFAAPAPFYKIVGLRFAYTPSAPSGVATLGANTFSGAQTAPAFVGDGSRLTNLPRPPGVATLGANVFSGTQRAPAFVGNGSGLTGLPFPSGAATLGANAFTGTQTLDTGNLDLDASTGATGNITKNGTRFLHNFGGGNVFLGLEAGNITMTGTSNTAIGNQALQSNTAGFSNTACGREALRDSTTGVFNTAVGASALISNTTATGNTAIGADALHDVTTGVNNVAVGRLAGSNATTGSNNIYLGGSVFGDAGDSFTMRLGGPQTKTFIKGIRGITTINNNAIPVLIDSLGQLGTVNSSRRFKEDIHDMRGASSRLLKLRPVTFRYTQAYADGSKPQQYGLVAEEVAEVFPELAVHDADGQVETVHYETLNVLLLNELQKQQRRIEALEQRLNQGR